MLTVMGKPDDLTALFHNPAGLADLKGVRSFLFVSPAILSTSFRMQALDAKRFPELYPPGCGTGSQACPWPTDAEGYYTADIRPEKYFGIIPYLSGGTDLGFLGPKGKDITVAAAIYSPNFYAAYLPEDAPTAYSAIGGYFVVVSAALGAGWRINDFISVGAGFSYNYMRLSIAQKISLANSLTPPGEDPAGLAAVAQNLIGDLRMDYEGIEHGFGWTAGVLISPLPWLNIGLTYTGNTNPRFRGDVDFSAYNERFSDPKVFNDVVHSVGYKLPTTLEIEQAIPHALFGGINVLLGSRVELAVDVRFWFYNQFSIQTIRPIYDPNEAGSEPLTEEAMSKDKQYKLSWQVTGGIMVRPLASYPNLELMAGTGYDQSPIPDQTLTLDNPNMSHTKFTLGVRWRVNDHWTVAGTYLLNIYTPRDVRDSQTSPPNNVQIASHSHSPALSVGYIF